MKYSISYNNNKIQNDNQIMNDQSITSNSLSMNRRKFKAITDDNFEKNK